MSETIKKTIHWVPTKDGIAELNEEQYLEFIKTNDIPTGDTFILGNTVAHVSPKVKK